MVPNAPVVQNAPAAQNTPLSFKLNNFGAISNTATSQVELNGAISPESTHGRRLGNGWNLKPPPHTDRHTII